MEWKRLLQCHFIRRDTQQSNVNNGRACCIPALAGVAGLPPTGRRGRNPRVAPICRPYRPGSGLPQILQPGSRYAVVPTPCSRACRARSRTYRGRPPTGSYRILQARR